MIKDRYLNKNNLKRVLVIFLVLYFISSGIRFIYDVVDSKGFFGIGLPAKMEVFLSKSGNFSILHPKTWRTADTPHGNHGDRENIAYSKPFRTWPSLYVAAKKMPAGNIDQVALWGKTRIVNLPHYEENGFDEYATPNLSGISRKYVWQSEWLFSIEKTIQCADYYALIEETGYILQFCAEQSQWPDVESVFHQMIESFRVR